MSDTITDASPDYRNRQLKDVLSEITNDIAAQNAKKAKPLLSIVTICDEANEQKWLLHFLKNLPVCETGEIEVILCKTFKGKPENVALPENTVQTGISITYCAVCFDEWSFSDARNAAKEVAKGKWILSLDTDEYLIQNQVSDLLNCISKADEAIGAMMVTILSHHFEFTDNPVSAVRAIRLFRNIPEIRWQCKVHETIDFSLLKTGAHVGDSTITIFHKGYEIPQEGLKGKLERNLELLMQDFHQNKNDNIKHYITEYVKRTVRHLDKLQ